MTAYVLQMRMIVNSKDAGFAPVGASAVRCAGWWWGPCVGARKPAGLGPNSPKVTDCSGLILHVIEDDAPVREALVLVLEGEGMRSDPGRMASSFSVKRRLRRKICCCWIWSCRALAGQRWSNASSPGGRPCGPSCCRGPGGGPLIGRWPPSRRWQPCESPCSLNC